MLGTCDPQPVLFYQITLEQFVIADHPMRKLWTLIDTARIRHCTPRCILTWAVRRFRRSSCCSWAGC
jgi:hypothetical protein